MVYDMSFCKLCATRIWATSTYKSLTETRANESIQMDKPSEVVSIPPLKAPLELKLIITYKPSCRSKCTVSFSITFRSSTPYSLKHSSLPFKRARTMTNVEPNFQISQANINMKENRDFLNLSIGHPPTPFISYPIAAFSQP